MLTAADIEQKTFSTALRGYDLDEVDDFLDEVVATIRDLAEQLEEARSARADAIAVPVPAPEAVLEPEPVFEPGRATEAETPVPAAPQIDEGAIGRALIAAQTAADKLLEEAQSQANSIVDGAKSEAETWSAERDAKRREAEAEIAALASRVAAVRSELAVLAGEVSDKLDQMEAVIEDAEETGTGSEIGPEEDSDDGAAVIPMHLETDDPYEQVAGTTDEVVGEDPQEEVAETVEETSEYREDGSDDLEEILNGVANDLQLGSDEDDSPEETDQEDR